MHSATAVNYYRGSKSYHTLMVHRGPPEDTLAQTESIKLTPAEAWLVVNWAEKVLDSKDFRFVSMNPSGWTIFLPHREVQTTVPLWLLDTPAKKGTPCEEQTGRN